MPESPRKYYSSQLKENGGALQVGKTASAEPKKRKRPPAKSLEARENQLIELAVEVAEEQMRNGTASAQVITHFLKLGTTRAALEKEKLERENNLLRAKAEHIDSMDKIEGLYNDAIKAMKHYSGSDFNNDYDEEL